MVLPLVIGVNHEHWSARLNVERSLVSIGVCNRMWNAEGDCETLKQIKQMSDLLSHKFLSPSFLVTVEFEVTAIHEIVHGSGSTEISMSNMSTNIEFEVTASHEIVHGRGSTEINMPK